MDRHKWAQRSLEIKKELAVERQSVADDTAKRQRLLREFKQRFIEARSFLFSEGYEESPVVAIVPCNPGPGYVVDKVFRFKALPIGGIFLHNDVFYKGMDGKADASSLLRGIRKGDMVVHVSRDFLKRPVDNNIVIVPPGFRTKPGVLAFRENCDSVTYTPVDEWLDRGMEVKLRSLHRR